MSILFTPRSALAAPAPDPQTRARANNVTESAALASNRNWIVSGLDLPTSGSRTFNISGKAWVAGYVIVLDSEAFTAPPATTSTVYLGLVRDGNGDVTGVTLATSPHASGDYVVLGAVTTDGSNVTVRDYDNRSPSTQVDPVTAAGVSYDPAASGLSSTDAQGAIDEVAAMAASSSDITRVSTASPTFTGTTPITMSEFTVADLPTGQYIGELNVELRRTATGGSPRPVFRANTTNGTLTVKGVFSSAPTLPAVNMSTSNLMGFSGQGLDTSANYNEYSFLSATMLISVPPGNVSTITIQFYNNDSGGMTTRIVAGSCLVLKKL